MAYPGRQQIYESTIRRMVAESLKIQEDLFASEHASDSDAQLLAYLSESAHRLGHSPHPGEITGGNLIEQRFGSWNDALTAAGLPAPTTPNQYNTFQLVQQETLRQKERYRQYRAQKRQQARKKRAEKAARRLHG